jgi:hypothetical protein
MYITLSDCNRHLPAIGTIGHDRQFWVGCGQSLTKNSWIMPVLECLMGTVVVLS